MQGKYLHNEKELLIRLIEGDEAAFETIYYHYSPRLYGNLLKMVKTGHLASEILQDVFIKIWNKRQQIDPENSFRSWLFKIAENAVYDCFRKAARDKALQQALLQAATDHYLHIEETLITKENEQLLEDVINTLPPQRRQIFRLCKIEGKTYEEVSKLLGISTSTISDHIVKANRAILQHLKGNQQLAIGVITLLIMMK